MPHVTSLADLPADGFLTEAEVASYLRVSTASLKMNRYRGCGPASAKVGHRVRYTVGAVRAFLAAATTARADERTDLVVAEAPRIAA